MGRRLPWELVHPKGPLLSVSKGNRLAPPLDLSLSPGHSPQESNLSAARAGRTDRLRLSPPPSGWSRLHSGQAAPSKALQPPRMCWR